MSQRISCHLFCLSSCHDAGVLCNRFAHSPPSVNLMSNWLTGADEAKNRNRTADTQRPVCGSVQRLDSLEFRLVPHDQDKRNVI